MLLQIYNSTALLFGPYLYFRAMNFLAHIYLSGNKDAVKVGNFMADSIRGKKYMDYAPDLQKGILLHRFIDSYTDAHTVFRQSTKRLQDHVTGSLKPFRRG